MAIRITVIAVTRLRGAPSPKSKKGSYAFRRLAGAFGVALACALAATGAPTASRSGPGSRSVCRDALHLAQRGVPTSFASSHTGLWAPRKSRCVYLVESRGARKVVWRLSAGLSVKSIQWAPDGSKFVVAVRGRARFVVVIAKNGARVLGRFRGRDAAFLRDGSLAILRRDGIYLARGTREQPLAPMRSLERAAGFRCAGSGPDIGESVNTNWRGYGDRQMAVWWSNGRARKVVMLVVDLKGRVRRASPVFAHRVGTLGWDFGGWAWNPRGDLLMLASVIPPVHGGDHDHTLDSWTRRTGWRRLLQSTPHYEKFAWAKDGSAVLLNCGWVVSRTGGILRRHVDVIREWFLVHWTA